MLEYVSAEQRKALEHCVALSLVRQQRDNQSGLVTLVFNIVYAPYIQMRYVEYVFFFKIVIFMHNENHSILFISY